MWRCVVSNVGRSQSCWHNKFHIHTKICQPMNARILNRDFTHPDDGWYQIEPKGEHPNRRAKLVQVIDDNACQQIVNRFNADADAGSLSHGHEMLIDHEHFKHDDDKETRAYGWLSKLQNRADGIYGQIRWTDTGKQAVDGGDYRFFSTEYDPGDLKILNEGKIKRVRPVRLDGLTLTNNPNNKGGRPITNRNSVDPAIVEFLQTPEGENLILNSVKKFRHGLSESAADKTTTTNKGQKMKSVCTLLGLSADASEEAVHAAVSKIINRGDITPEALKTLREEHADRKTQIDMLLGEQVDGLLAENKITNTKVINRVKPALLPLKNREERIAYLTDLGLVGDEGEEKTEHKTGRILNRGSRGGSGGGAREETQEDSVTPQQIDSEVRKIMNRDNVKFDAAFNKLRREQPKLFVQGE